VTQSTPAATTSAPALVRTIGPFQLTFYALGSMLGTGIYGLIGQAAGLSGNAVWLSFLVALVAALLTALSYASLGSRYPRAGGAAYATHRAFQMPLLSFTVGLALVCSGLTSVATQSRVFAVNAAALTGINAVPTEWIALGFILLMTGIVFRGIRESMWINVLCTLIEAAGLLLVISFGMSYWGKADYFEIPPEKADVGLFMLAVQGTALTFFAFIGFEDAINVAEECKAPERTIPIGLITAALIAAVLYVAVAITAVSVVPWRELAAAPAPLAEVMKRAAPGFPPWIMLFITLFSVGNTALVNYITASRLIYGMSQQNLLPSGLGRVHAARRTPHMAILALLALLVPLALLGSIKDLASATVLLLLFVFTIVNAALFAVQRKASEPHGHFEVPSFVPFCGMLVCAALILVRLTSSDWAFCS
jgi:basic amino acid/polyamine antiporter, APA family